MSQILEGKVAAVTGAASGIGLASSEAMLSNGATVVMVDRDAAALAKICARLGPRGIPLVIDLLNPESCNALLDGILEKTGKLDILHANAGSYIGGDLLETTPDAIDRMLNLNVNSVMKNVHNVLPHMIERKSGDIIITSSVAGHTAVVWEPVYAASKWAMTCFVQTMRRQALKHGIRVGSVSPGPVNSALLKDWPAENLRKAKESGSIIEPTDVAEAVLFMLSRPRNVCIRDIVILPSAFDL